MLFPFAPSYSNGAICEHDAVTCHVRFYNARSIFFDRCMFGAQSDLGGTLLWAV